MVNKNYNLCIISASKNVYSETFIAAHYNLLSGNKFFLYQTDSSFLDINDIALYKPGIFNFKKIFNYIFKKKNINQSYYKLKSLKKYLKKKHIDIVLAEYGVTGELIANICFILNIPLVVHFHGYDAHQLSVIEQNNYYKNVFEKASAIIAVSKFMSEQLLSIGADKKKIFYNPCGPSLKFKPATINEKSNSFLSIGRFVDKKSPFLTILAFEKVYKEYQDIKLIMCGDGPLLESCKILVKALKIEHAIEFLGSQPHDIIVKLMSESRAFVQHSVQPSHGDSEGTPVAVLEACYSGLPVIATRHAGIKDIVIDKKTGFLVDEFDINGMADYMKLVLTDLDRAREIGSNAHKHIAENYSMDKSINNLDKIISNVLNNTYNINNQ